MLLNSIPKRLSSSFCAQDEEGYFGHRRLEAFTAQLKSLDPKIFEFWKNSTK